MIEFIKNGKIFIVIANGILASVGWFYFFKEGNYLPAVTGLMFTLFLILEIKGLFKK
mgnify:FL=1